MISNYRRNSTLRALKSFLHNPSETASNNEDIYIEKPKQLFSVHLPGSLPSMEQVSPNLWSWLNAGESFGDDDLPRVFSPSGDEITIFPHHLHRDFEFDSISQNEEQGLVRAKSSASIRALR
jgi:superfamily I DNA and/or RNA helicase